MQFKMLQRDLLHALQTAYVAVPSRTTVPSFMGIRIRYKDGVVTFTGTDIVLTITHSAEAEGEEGECVVPAKNFIELMKRLPNDQVTFTADGDGAKIQIGKAKYKLPVLGSDFIDTTFESKMSFSVDALIFNEMVKKTVFAASDDNNKGALAGMLFQLRDRNLELVAIDGFRLAKTKTEIDTDIEKKFLVPAYILKKMVSVLGNGEITFNLSDKTLRMTFGVNEARIQLMENVFPDTDSIIPTEFTTAVKMDTDTMFRSVDRNAIFSSVGKNNLVKLHAKKDVITISSKSESGIVYEEIPAIIEGEELALGFNARFMMDALRNIDDEYVSVNMTTAVSPIVITPIEKENCLYLVLPVRLSSNG